MASNYHRSHGTKLMDIQFWTLSGSTRKKNTTLKSYTHRCMRSVCRFLVIGDKHLERFISLQRGHYRKSPCQLSAFCVGKQALVYPVQSCSDLCKPVPEKASKWSLHKGRLSRLPEKAEKMPFEQLGWETALRQRAFDSWLFRLNLASLQTCPMRCEHRSGAHVICFGARPHVHLFMF